MTTYILKRLLLLPLMLFGITLASFCIIALAPGASASGRGGGELSTKRRLTQRQLEVMQETFHAGEPLYLRYLYWLGAIQPDISLGLRKEWLNRKLNECKEKHIVTPPLTAELLKRWDRPDYEKDQLLAQADKDKLTLLSEWLDNKAEDLKKTGRVAPPATKELLKKWTALSEAANRLDTLDTTTRQELEKQALAENNAATAFNASNIEKLMRALGEPPPKHGLLFGDFGKSVTTPTVTVAQRLAEAIPVTILMSIISIFIGYAASIPLGIFSATHANTKTDSSLTIFLFILYSLPSFWVAVLLIKGMVMLKQAGLPSLPIQGLFPQGAEEMPTLQLIWETTKHLFLPIFVDTFGGLAVLARFMRVGMIDIIRLDYIRTARAKGCPENLVIYKHALRNSLIPIITLMAGLLPSLIGGSVIIETIFNINGMGLLGYKALLERDYTILMADLTIGSVLTLLGILFSDIAYVLVDPRISFEKEG